MMLDVLLQKEPTGRKRSLARGQARKEWPAETPTAARHGRHGTSSGYEGKSGRNWNRSALDVNGPVSATIGSNHNHYQQ